MHDGRAISLGRGKVVGSVEAFEVVGASTSDSLFYSAVRIRQCCSQRTLVLPNTAFNPLGWCKTH
jgi:hypothetical protein